MDGERERAKFRLRNLAKAAAITQSTLGWSSAALLDNDDDGHWINWLNKSSKLFLSINVRTRKTCLFPPRRTCLWKWWSHQTRRLDSFGNHLVWLEKQFGPRYPFWRQKWTTHLHTRSSAILEEEEAATKREIKKSKLLSWLLSPLGVNKLSWAVEENNCPKKKRTNLSSS